MHHTLAIIFIVLAVIGAAIGGFLDISGQESFFGISKAHFWSDSVFMLVFAVIALTWNCKQPEQKESEKSK